MAHPFITTAHTDRWNVLERIMHDIDECSMNTTYVFKTDADDVVARMIGLFVDDLGSQVDTSTYVRVMQQIHGFKERPYDTLQVSAVASEDGTRTIIRFHMYCHLT